MSECKNCGADLGSGTAEWCDRNCELEDQNYELKSRLSKMEAALDKINNIRNSIVGAQTLHWSEHIYPLVEALNEAGFKGLPYPEARKNVGTLLDHIAKLEVAVDAATEAMAEMLSWSGKGLDVRGWHMNGDLEPLDNIICDSGIQDAIDALAAAREGK